MSLYKKTTITFHTPMSKEEKQAKYIELNKRSLVLEKYLYEIGYNYVKDKIEATIYKTDTSISKDLRIENPHLRGIGKSHALCELAKEYNIPIYTLARGAVENSKLPSHLDMYSTDIFYFIKNFDIVILDENIPNHIVDFFQGPGLRINIIGLKR